MVKILFLSAMMLVPAIALADCPLALSQLQGDLSVLTAESTGAIEDVTGACPEGFDAQCWPLEDGGDLMIAERVDALDTGLAAVLGACATETNPGVLVWAEDVTAQASVARARFAYLRDLHVGFTQ